MPRTYRRQVWLAKINRRDATLFDRDFKSDLATAIDPSVKISRYGKTWRFSRPTVTGQRLVGKLGFDRSAQVAGAHFDEETEDFVVAEAPTEQGNFAIYVVDLRSQVVAVEERRPDIYLKPFLGAFQKLLDLSNYKFEVDPMSSEQSFRDWVAAMDVVTRFHATLRPPNPSSSRRAREVRKLMTETDADTLQIDATAAEDAGLTIQETLLEATAEHAAGGNGSFTASALKNGARRFFHSTRQLLKGEIQVTNDDDEDSLVRKIVSVLRDLTASNRGRRDD